jgi:hypothetical protein
MVINEYELKSNVCVLFVNDDKRLRRVEIETKSDFCDASREEEEEDEEEEEED